MPSFHSRLGAAADEQPTTATGRVYLALKTEILTGRIRPGSMLNEGELAQKLDVSKTPVREALGMLAHEGFVEVRPRRGYLVTPVTLRDVKEIYHLRSLLEPAAARLAATNATAEQRDRLRHLARDSAEHDYEGRVRHAHLFHEVLALASGSDRLTDALVGALDECQRLFFLGLDLQDLVDHTVHEHEALLAALDRGDADAAEQIARAQVEEARDVVLARIAASLTSPEPTVAADAVVIGPSSDEDGQG